MDVSLDQLSKYSCMALPVVSQGTREVGVFFGPAIHIGSTLASGVLKGVEKSYCLKQCLTCDWPALSPSEWNYEQAKLFLFLAKESAEQQLKDQIGGKVLKVYHGSQLLLGSAELLSRYSDVKKCCTTYSEQPIPPSPPENKDVEATLKSIQAGEDFVGLIESEDDGLNEVSYFTEEDVYSPESITSEGSDRLLN